MGGPKAGYPETGIEKPVQPLTVDAILSDSVNKRHPGLSKVFVDGSLNPPQEFTVTKIFPDILIDNNQEEKNRLLGKYSLIWNYESGTTYWIIENMRKVSRDSHGKIEHFGFANYLKDNLKYMEDGLDYALELFVRKRDIDEREVHSLALISQRKLQEAGDAKGAPVIGVNPLNYMSERCIKAKGKIILFKIKDNLKLLGSTKDFSTYSELIRGNYSSEEYREYISKFIQLNKAYLDAVNDSQASLPFTKKWAWPFVSLGVWKETGNAHEFIVKLYDFLYKNIYGTAKNE